MSKRSPQVILKDSMNNLSRVSEDTRVLNKR